MTTKYIDLKSKHQFLFNNRECLLLETALELQATLLEHSSKNYEFEQSEDVDYDLTQKMYRKIANFNRKNRQNK
jgi:hypothetical protein